MAPDKLRALLETLREFGVTEYEAAGVRVTLSAEPRPVVQAPKDTGAVTNPKRAAYERLFRGGPPSFEDFKDAGMVTE